VQRAGQARPRVHAQLPLPERLGGSWRGCCAQPVGRTCGLEKLVGRAVLGAGTSAGDARLFPQGGAGQRSVASAQWRLCGERVHACAEPTHLELIKRRIKRSMMLRFTLIKGNKVLCTLELPDSLVPMSISDAAGREVEQQPVAALQCRQCTQAGVVALVSWGQSCPAQTAWIACETALLTACPPWQSLRRPLWCCCPGAWAPCHRICQPQTP
jgi:hypothetical protein